MNVGFLHPGAMGETLAATCRQPGLWVGQDRSPETRARAAAAGIADVGTLPKLCEQADVIVAICPPAEATAVAGDVADCGFNGLYVDANAISPDTARAIAARFDRFVDGSVVGPPAKQAGTTRLYLSGEEADTVAALWTGTDLEPVVLDGVVGRASALKMAYATWTKVSSALLLNVCGLADAEGVRNALVAEWGRSQPGTAERAERVAEAVGPKAWRFVGEMEQIAASFAEAGLPTGFADGAAEVYGRLAGFKGVEGVELEPAIAALLD